MVSLCCLDVFLVGGVEGGWWFWIIGGVVVVLVWFLGSCVVLWWCVFGFWVICLGVSVCLVRFVVIGLGLNVGFCGMSGGWVGMGLIFL